MAHRILLIEGTDDEHVLKALFGVHAVPEVFQIERAEGIERLLESAPVRLKVESELECLAVILDADDDPRRRWTQLRDRLIHAGFAEIPQVPDPVGTVVDLHTGTRLGIWLMPNNALPGMLEDFVSFLIPDGDSMLPHVDGFLAGIPESERRYPAAHHAKARIHTWLAIQEKPGRPMGQAITASYLNASEERIRPFLDWLRLALVD